MRCKILVFHTSIYVNGNLVKILKAGIYMFNLKRYIINEIKCVK